MAESVVPVARARRVFRSALIGGGLVLAVIVALAAMGAAALWLAAGTRAFNQRLDSRALAFMAHTAERGARDTGPARLPFHDAAELEALTRWTGPPLVPTVRPQSSHAIDRPQLIEEQISFPSAIALAHAESNTVYATVYRHGRLGERPIVLCVPGLFVSEAALLPLSWFMLRAIDRGADVIVFEPSYHLTRTPAGFRSGEAFFATSLDDHLNAFAQELSDLRRLAAWLRALGTPAVGAFGGSLGALELLRLCTWDDTLDFLTAFIPVVRPVDLIQRPEAEPMRRRLAAEGGSLDAMLRIYGAFDLLSKGPSEGPLNPPRDGAVEPSSPAPTRIAGPSRLDPARISVLYGGYDIVSRPEIVEDWARAWGVTRLHRFDRGHTLALFSGDARDAYAHALDEDLHALAPR